MFKLGGMANNKQNTMTGAHLAADGSCRSTSSLGGGNSCKVTLNVWSEVLRGMNVRVTTNVDYAGAKKAVINLFHNCRLAVTVQ